MDAKQAARFREKSKQQEAQAASEREARIERRQRTTKARKLAAEQAAVEEREEAARAHVALEQQEQATAAEVADAAAAMETERAEHKQLEAVRLAAVWRCMVAASPCRAGLSATAPPPRRATPRGEAVCRCLAARRR